MGLFDAFSRSRGRARPVGQNLERGTQDEHKQRRRNRLVKGSILALLVVLTVLAFPRSDFFQYTVQVGDDWRQETLRAPFEFAIYKSEETLQEERQAVRETVPPFFRDVPDAQSRLTANRDTVEQQLDRVFQAYEDYLRNQSRGRTDQAIEDSLRYMQLRRTAWPKLNAEQWQRLLMDYVERVPGLTSRSRTVPDDTPLVDQLLQDAWEYGSLIIRQGVLDVPRDTIQAEEIIVRNQRELTERRVQKDNVYGQNEVYTAAQDYFSREYPDQPQLVNLATSFLRSIFVSSLEYMKGESMEAWQRAANGISPTRGKVARGDVIVRQGQTVTPEIKRRLTSLERVQEERSGPSILWKRTTGQLLLTLATYLIFFLYLFVLRRNVFTDNSRILLIAILFGIIIGLFAVGVRLPGQAIYAVPVAIVSVVLTVMFDSRIGLFGTLTLAIIAGLLLGYNFEFTIATLFAGTLGVFSVRDIKNRGQFFLSAGIVFVGYLFILGASWLLLNRVPPSFGSQILMVGINSFLLILAYPLLWVFERAFDITTDLTLLELSDTNRPLLKELSLRAPGTFNHSLQVANLAEAAAAAIGANALLTRVGALYHDIGKMLKPEYFVENQRPGDNPHDQLKPRMSALIIASHVKEGLEMGRQYTLPKRVLDFIPMHHGTTRIEYFYRKAVDDRSEGAPEILESEFRYPGPRPNSKETGILMLSDGVEAASRSLSEPTHKRLETLIDMIVKARIEDGQLDDTDLTFRDLTQIKQTFLSLLLGIYHVRVRYPDQDAEDEGPPETKPEQRASQQEKPERAEDGDLDEPEGHVPASIEALREQGLVGIPEHSIASPSPADEAGEADQDDSEAEPPDAERVDGRKTSDATPPAATDADNAPTDGARDEPSTTEGAERNGADKSEQPDAKSDRRDEKDQ
ncbi:MAG: HDIG domain-containing protein [Bacteroidetes bacterium]|jgi:putative nucleotidyltransferase with HDIG domain|nr:HDIG domain-containing protein [Bacteroidota bacterium]